jgi:hypothetical protein
VVFPGEEKNVRILERDGQKAPPQKIAQALEAAPDYRMNHRPLKVENGAAQLNKAYEVFGQDIYGPNALQYFGGGDPRETKTVAALKRLRDNPDAEVTIYRGVPADATGGIAKGDWVTLDKDVAQDYANLKPGQKGKVLTMKVKAKDVTTWPDSLLEFGYYPADFSKMIVSFMHKLVDGNAHRLNIWLDEIYERKRRRGRMEVHDGCD